MPRLTVSQTIRRHKLPALSQNGFARVARSDVAAFDIAFHQRDDFTQPSPQGGFFHLKTFNFVVPVPNVTNRDTMRRFVVASASIIEIQ